MKTILDITALLINMKKNQYISTELIFNPKIIPKIQRHTIHQKVILI